MIQLSILTGKQAGSHAMARRFPFVVGRHSSCALVLEDDGVWDRHFEIGLAHGRDLIISAGPDALLIINGERVAQAAVAVRNGDLLELGSVRIRLGFAPTRQRPLWLRESLTWILLGALCLGQVALIYLLSE